TLRRLLRSAGIASPRKRRPPAHRQRRLRSAREGELVQLDASPHDWLEGRGPQLTALGMQDDATGKILAAQFFPSETTAGYFHLLQSLLRRFGVPLAFYGDRSGIFVRHDDHWTIEEELAGKRQPTQFGRALEQLGITFLAAQSPQAKGRIERLWGVLQGAPAHRPPRGRRARPPGAQSCPAPFPPQQQPPLRSLPAPGSQSLAPGSGTSRADLLLHASTRRQQRQRGAMGRTAPADP